MKLWLPFYTDKLRFPKALTFSQIYIIYAYNIIVSLNLCTNGYLDKSMSVVYYGLNQRVSNA